MIQQRKDDLLGIYRGDEEDFVIFSSFYLRLVTDPDDGYRSYLDVEVHEGAPPDRVTKFYSPLDRCTAFWCDGDEDGDGDFDDLVRVIGDDGYLWLRAGTDYSDDYYPCAYVEWNPRKPE
jgi:hypothetical protein